MANLPKWESCVVTKEEKDANSVAGPIEIIKEVTADIMKTAADMGAKIN